MGVAHLLNAVSSPVLQHLEAKGCEFTVFDDISYKIKATLNTPKGAVGIAIQVRLNLKGGTSGRSRDTDNVWSIGLRANERSPARRGSTREGRYL